MKTERRIYRGTIKSIAKLRQTKEGNDMYSISFSSGTCIFIKKPVEHFTIKEGSTVYFRGSFVSGVFLISAFTSEIWKYNLQGKVDNVDDANHYNNKKSGWRETSEYDKLMIDQEEKLQQLYHKYKAEEIEVTNAYAEDSLIAYSRQ
jgi:hypothetical protein